MAKKIFLTLLLATLFLSFPKANANGMGRWKTYMAYHKVSWVEKAGSKYYVLASKNLYIYNEKDNSIRTYDRTNGLSDVNIEHIAWNNQAKKLLIIYENYNMDLLDEKGNTSNLSDYHSKSIPQSKTINHLNMVSHYCYISTGFGIIKLNMATEEISNTYNLGFDVKYSYIEGNAIYAASESKGIYKGELTHNLLDKNQWRWVANYVPKPYNADPELIEKVKKLNAGGPQLNHFYNMVYHKNKLYTVPGLFESGGASLLLPGAVQVLSDNEWTFFQDNIASITGYNYEDMNCIAVNPKDENNVFVAGRAGLYEFQDGKLKSYYNKDNSKLRGAVVEDKDHPGQTIESPNDYVLINGITFDKEGNLWILNSQTYNTSILKLSPDRTMTSFHKSELMKDSKSPSVMCSPIIDSRNLLWFTNNHYELPALFRYQPSTDNFQIYRNFVNQDGGKVPLTAARCVVEDFQHNIWVGTNLGPLLLKAQDVAEENPTFYQVKIPRNDGTNLADYLLSGVNITCIAIDGAGRKWFGTGSNGVYLLSEDNLTQIHHFLKSNSPLLSDNIESIAINEKTGEVFFGTDKGLCSYMGDATKGSDEIENDLVYAYPNPVKPGYTGAITIVGLSYQSEIRITTTSGELVNKGMSNGGTYVWNGNDLNGKAVASGVYMVHATNQEGTNGTVCKVAIVR